MNDEEDVLHDVVDAGIDDPEASHGAPDEIEALLVDAVERPRLDGIHGREGLQWGVRRGLGRREEGGHLA